MLRIISATLFLLFLAFLTLASGLTPFINYVYLIMSFLTFSVFAFDKYQSIKAYPRIRERTLFILIFCCGWPGALFAQSVLRHKSVKKPFIRLCLGLICCNLILLSLFIYQA